VWRVICSKEEAPDFSPERLHYKRGMEKIDILREVSGVFSEVFDTPGIVISCETTAKDIEDWDSLTHIQLIVAIEKHFNIRFTSLEIQNFKDVGDMCDVIKCRLGEL
jgi:acyl carrier protein